MDYSTIIYGALAGDAIGAHVEFQKAPVPAKSVKQAMKMDGGGTHCTAAGQITDDGEQALGLLRSLSEGSYRLSSALNELKDWYTSGPFDIGGTTSAALRKPKTLTYFDHVKQVKAVNQKSEANGALMRMAPLVAYCLKYEPMTNALAMAKSDALMTHPNSNCVLASQFYMALAYTVDADHYRQCNRGAVSEALRIVLSVASLTGTPTQTLEKVVNEALEAKELPKCDGWDQGYWGVALKCTIWALLHSTDYDHGIASIIERGGDTDTNACIAGAMLGLIHEVPAWRIERLHDCDTSKGRKRPKEWQTKGNLKAYIERLF